MVAYLEEGGSLTVACDKFYSKEGKLKGIIFFPILGP